MIRVGLIGCGNIADQHASAIRRIDGCSIVGVCDREELMARQLAERFHVESSFTDAAELLRKARPDVVHITTPPQSHFALGKQCLEVGVSVYMEKPFTLNVHEAETLLALAESRNLKITVGHNLQFSAEAEQMRALVRAGFLGGPPIHMDCIQCYSHEDPVYGSALLGDSTHWVRSLPGSLPHNVISHGIAKIAEFLSGDDYEVVVRLFTSDYLKHRGWNDIVDELRVIIHDSQNITGTFTFTTQFSAGANQFRLYGKTNALIVDNLNRLLVRVAQSGHKSYLRYFLGPRTYAREYLRSSWSNIYQFLRRDFHEGNSMKRLIELFYRAVSGEAPVPIPYREILTTARIMDSIFEQIPTKRPHNTPRHLS